MSDNTAVLAAIGLQTLGLIFALIKFSFGRNVKVEDDAKAAIQKKLDAHDAELANLQRQVGQTLNDLKTLILALPELKSAMQELGRAVEASREKQAATHKDDLKELEILLRQDMTRAVAPDLSAKVLDHEHRLAALERRAERTVKVKR